jgi:imidazolonepropionase-like amidohydrolase
VRRTLLASIFFLCTSTACAFASDATLRLDIVMGDKVAGQSVMVRHSDGSIDEDLEFNDRGRGPKLHTRVELAGDGLPSRVEIAGKDYLKREVHELATCDAKRCKWDSNDEHGEAPRGFYIPLQQTYALDAALLRLEQQHVVKLLPGGTARALKVAETTLTRGSERLHVSAYETSGFDFVPGIEWFDDQGAPFGYAEDGGGVVRAGWKDSIPKLVELQRPLGEARRQRIAKQVAHRPARLAIVHARLFDPAKKTITDDATIVIEGDRVKTVGAQLAAPKDAEVIDARGKTVLPGLWDMHVHLGDEDGLLMVAHGVTTVRDLGSDVAGALRRRARWEGNEELGPQLVLAGLVDGRGPFEAPLKVFADTPQEAVQVVDGYAAKGYAQLKIYSSIKPELVPTLVKEAHAKGMRVSGHVPAHMIAEDAVNAGFDEIQHINMVMLDLLATRDDDTRTPLRFTRVAEKGAEVDLDSPKVKALLDLFVKRHTVIDPTLSAFEPMFTTRPGHVKPQLAPILERLPAQVRRAAAIGALPVPDGMDEKYQEAFRRCAQLVKRMWERNIPIVAGTDDAPWGISLHHELELYSRAGIPNADVLAIATLGAAKVMRLDQKTGSIAPGKRADLVIVDGDPLAKMSDVRNVATVIRNGNVIDAVALQEALSIAPRQRTR